MTYCLALAVSLTLFTLEGLTHVVHSRGSHGRSRCLILAVSPSRSSSPSPTVSLSLPGYLQRVSIVALEDARTQHATATDRGVARMVTRQAGAERRAPAGFQR